MTLFFSDWLVVAAYFLLSAGIGLGFALGRGTLDVEYTQINDAVDYISVGYILPF